MNKMNEMNETKRNRLRSARFRALCIVIAALAVALITLVVAKYIKYTVEVKNTLTPAVSIIPPINEEFENNVKSNVYFQPDDPKKNELTEYPVYVRAYYVVTWEDKDGVRYYKTPKLGEDYTITLNNANWFQFSDGGDYYYYCDETGVPLAVSSKGQTEYFINKCEPLPDAQAPDGYTLRVDILVQTVQAVGYTDEDNPKYDGEIEAWRDAWSVFETTSADTNTDEPAGTDAP